MKISPDEAARIAKLSRLELDDDKLAVFAGQFGEILTHMDELNGLDTTDVEPMYSPAEYDTVFREDKAEKRHTRKEVLSNAPETDGQFFVVPKIV